MIITSKLNNPKMKEAIEAGKVDAVHISDPNLVDAIILKAQKEGLIDLISKALSDKRAPNAFVPYTTIMVLAIAAKMKIKNSLTDIPFAIKDAETLAKLGYNMWSNERSIKEEGLMEEGSIRNLVSKYTAAEYFDFYNRYIGSQVMPKLGILPDIYILDCSKVEVNLDNENYEKSEVVKIDNEVTRGYKIGTLRGLLDDSGLIVEVVFGSIKTHDFELTKNMIMDSKILKPGDILINDRGFISRTQINGLKAIKKVDTYIPAKANMDIYKEAIAIAKLNNKWETHPNKKRETQKIQLIQNLGMFWKNSEKTDVADVDINACVVWDIKDDKYFVFMTTDLKKTAKQIISTYEIRPEIEEDYRQIKDFWTLEDFKSTKYNFIAFHIVMTLIGYAYFQLYKNTEEGNKYIGKSLPIVLKKYNLKKPKMVVVYSGIYFGIFGFLDFMDIYSECSSDTKTILRPILEMV